MRTIIRGLFVGAFAVCLTAPQIQAAEKIRLGLGGEYIQYFGYADNNGTDSGDFTGFDVKADSELVFGGETTLDSGQKVGVEVTLKAQSAGDDQIDGTYLWSEGGFGRVEIGQADNTAVALHLTAPDVGFGLNDTDVSDWVVNPSDGNADSGFGSTYLYLGDDKATKISWFSPSLSGFRIAASYIPEFERDSGTQPNGDAVYRDAISVGLRYERQFGNAWGMALSAGFLGANSPSGVTGGASAEGYSLGVNVTVDAFTFGASYASTDGNPSGGTETGQSLDGSGFDVGVSYTFGPTAISLSYYKGEVEDEVDTAGDSTNDSVMASVRHIVGPGVTAIASLLHTRFEEDDGDRNEGTALIGGIVLEF
jgi:outer membrane protein OmpU